MSTSQVAETLNLPATVTVFPELCQGLRMSVLWHKQRKGIPSFGTDRKTKSSPVPSEQTSGLTPALAKSPPLPLGPLRLSHGISGWVWSQATRNMYRKNSDRKCCVALAGFPGCGLEPAVPWVLQPPEASMRWEGLWSPGLALTLPPSLDGFP